MDWNWLTGLLYGLLGGFFEFLPVSPQIHQAVLLKITGLQDPGDGIALAVHMGALAAVLLSSYSTVGKLSREQRIARQPRRDRKRQPDFVSLMFLRLLKIAAVPVTLSCLLAPWLQSVVGELWMVAIITVVSGIVVLLPHYMTQANKDARTWSPLDALLVGFGGILGVLPGFSRTGALTAVASMRGADREFALDFTYLLTVPALAALCAGDLGMLVLAEAPQAGVTFITCVLACGASFGAGFAGIRLMRFLAVKAGYESFAYHSLGIALLAYIFYLIG